MTIQNWTDYIMDWAKTKGWDKNPDGSPLLMGNMIANLHSEVSEAWEEIRNGHEPKEVYYKDIVVHESGEWKEVQDTKPEGFPIEIADLAIRLFHICGEYGIDLDKMIELKMMYNHSRPYRHGGKKA